MRWSKFLLLFQAVVTIIFGIIFLLSFISLDNISLDSIQKGFQSGEKITKENVSQEVEEIKNRYIIATYILLIIAVIEILLITRLFA